MKIMRVSPSVGYYRPPPTAGESSMGDDEIN